MLKVLFINMLGYGYINLILGLVEELIKRGEKIIYLVEEEFREKIEKIGVKFKGYKIVLSIDSLVDIRNSEERIRILLDLRM